MPEHKCESNCGSSDCRSGCVYGALAKQPKPQAKGNATNQSMAELLKDLDLLTELSLVQGQMGYQRRNGNYSRAPAHEEALWRRFDSDMRKMEEDARTEAVSPTTAFPNLSDYPSSPAEDSSDEDLGDMFVFVFIDGEEEKSEKLPLGVSADDIAQDGNIDSRMFFDDTSFGLNAYNSVPDANPADASDTLDHNVTAVEALARSRKEKHFLQHLPYPGDRLRDAVRGSRLDMSPRAMFNEEILTSLLKERARHRGDYKLGMPSPRDSVSEFNDAMTGFMQSSHALTGGVTPPKDSPLFSGYRDGDPGIHSQSSIFGRKKPTLKTYESVWDAISDSPEEAKVKELWSQLVRHCVDGLDGSIDPSDATIDALLEIALKAGLVTGELRINGKIVFSN